MKINLELRVKCLSAKEIAKVLKCSIKPVLRIIKNGVFKMITQKISMGVKNR